MSVDAGWFRAGRARIEAVHLGAVAALDAEETRRVAGPEADARAYLLLRPYLKRAVRVEIARPGRPGAVLAGVLAAPRRAGPGGARGWPHAIAHGRDGYCPAMASDSSRVWTAFSLVAGLGAAALTRKLLDRSWKAAAGKNPPENPADPDVSLGEAVMWASLTGADGRPGPDAGPAPGGELLRPLHRPPAAGAARRRRGVTPDPCTD